MKRIGALAAFLALAALFAAGCEEEVTEVTNTGVEIGFSNCITVGIWVWIDDEYKGFMSTDNPEFFETTSGSHEIYCRSNAVETSTRAYYCWTNSVSVSENNVSALALDCVGAICEDTTGTYASE
jgi:hypothetical protein